jgi:Xaa-Pro dipeptidase
MSVTRITEQVGTHMPFPIEEYERRWQALDAELARLGYDTAVIWGRSGGNYDRAGTITYLTNFASHSSGQEWSSGDSAVGRSFAALIFRRGHEPELHIAEPVTTAEPRYVATANIAEQVQDIGAGLAERLRELGIEGPVAYLGDDFLPAQIYRTLLVGTPQIEWVAEDFLLDEIQSHKSERELDLYREAGAVACQALSAFMEALIAGERQCDAAAKAASIIIRSGGGFQRLGCHTGPRSELAMWDNPFYGYSEEAAKPGDMVRAWVYGPIRHGYWIDPGRSSACGEPTLENRRLIEQGADLTEYLVGQIKAGVTPREVGVLGDEHSRKLGLSEDMGGAIWDLYGHGLSTFWLGPIIPAHGAETFVNGRGFQNVDRPFHVAQVFTVETFLREPGVGTATFEEVFIVGENGVERLTDETPMLFW